MEMGERRGDESTDDLLHKQWADANADLIHAVDLGEFVISEKAENIIQTFLRRNVGDGNVDPLSEIIKKILRILNNV